jgi:hypothetical protein
MTGVYSPGVRESARNLMVYVGDAENRRRTGVRDDVSAFLAASGSKSVPVPGIDEPRRQDDGRPRFVPDFRVVQPGEDRSEGTLERIDCANGKATFRLREASAGPLVGQLRDVDFIAYRDDLSGGITCGPLAQPMHVYVTWRAGSQPGSDKTVVAVEFLPK